MKRYNAVTGRTENVPEPGPVFAPEAPPQGSRSRRQGRPPGRDASAGWTACSKGLTSPRSRRRI